LMKNNLIYSEMTAEEALISLETSIKGLSSTESENKRKNTAKIP